MGVPTLMAAGGTLTETLKKLTAAFEADIGASKASALVTNDGLVISSHITDPTVDPELVPALISVLLTSAGRAGAQLNRGPLEKMMVTYKNGKIVAIPVSPKVFFLTVVPPDAAEGLIMIQMERYAKKFDQVLT
ncbi:MAG: roadblock/LC7 domain-containing protein [Euryarchaeota archaeon]|nr:roadblock/LC7 domain-containing protein [Euryarchaeota archaeon]